jgi:alpha-L-rhamnosidase
MRPAQGGRKLLALVVLTLLTALISPTPLAVGENASSTLRPVDLRVNYSDDARGIDDQTPSLSWRLTSHRRNQEQSAYQVRVAGHPDQLVQDDPDVWDSGKVESGMSVNVAYGGPVLESRQRLYWSVRVWDERDRPSPWSKPGQWEMGLLHEDDWKAEWISDPAWLAQDRVNPLVISFPKHSARFVRIDVTRLGKPIKEGWEQPVSRLQLAEFQALQETSSFPRAPPLVPPRPTMRPASGRWAR